MRVLLLGSGGREHALGWRLCQDPNVDLTSLPGNPGLAQLGAVVEGIDPTDAGAVAAMAAARGFDLVVVGPEAPLAAGVADALRRQGIPVCGPDRAAARLETSKEFAKRIMDAAGVPTAAWAAFTDRESAHRHIDASEGPYVVKADGLAAGKGVLVTPDPVAATAWVDECLGGAFGDAGATVIIEDHLDGPELSIFAVCDGDRAIALEPARDYKRLADGDAGPNTGGMGSYSPVPDLPADIIDFTLDRVVAPVLQELAGDGISYRGFLYVGLVLTADGPKVLEFNCRLGDPETQVVVPRLTSPLVGLLAAAATGTLADYQPAWSNEAAVNVVLAAEGYPTAPVTGVPISGDLRPEPSSVVFHAGTATDDGRLVTAGGRVLNVVGLGPDLASARRAAYARVATIRWPGMQYRTDIAGAS